MKSTINEWLYKQLWKNKKRSMLKKIVYIIIPWFLLAILYSIIYVQGAGEVKGGYGFWQDKTNMFVLPYMFLFSYYVGGRNPSYLKESIISYFEKLRTDEDKKVCKKKINNIDLIKTIGHALAIIISIIGAGYFIYKASLNGDLNWYSKLNRWQMGYYSLFVFSTWYMSLNLLIDTVCTSIKVYKISIYKPEIQLDHLDRCGGIANVFTALSWNIGLAKIAENVFDDTLLEKLTEYYNGFKEMCNDELNGKKTALEKKIKNLEGDMEYLITMMIKKRTESLFEKLEKMEEEKANLQSELRKLEQTQKTSPVSQSDIEYTLWHAQKMLKNKTLSNTKQLIESLVDRVIIYEDYIQIKSTFAKTKDYNFDPPTKEELLENGQKNNLGVTDVTPRCGGEGGS